MKKPTIHVVIPVYNAQLYLEDAVTSILSQPYQNMRLYLIDDGSCDGSAALCDELAARYENIRVLHQPNGGVSAARNAGIRLALGAAADDDYLGFCDADDQWMKDAVCESLFAGEQYDIHTFGIYAANQSMNRYYIDSKFEDHVETEIERVIWAPGCFCTSLYVCSMLRTYDVRFSEITKYAEDIMFTSQCRYSARSICFHKEFLYIYRHNASSAMHSVRHKLSKIDYYTQIINGWIDTEAKINACAERTGRTTNMGSTLASIYFLDMAAMHYQDWGSRKKLEATFQAHPCFYLFENMDKEAFNARQYRDHLMLKKHPVLFRVKNNFLGIISFAKKTLYCIPLVKALYIRRKYTMKMLPESRRDRK